MTPQAREASVRTEIVVEAPIERAFRVFTEDFGSFKPPEHNLLGVEIVETVYSPHEGGHLYDRGVDGSESRWARVLAYEPPYRVVFSCGHSGADAGRAGAPQPRPPRRGLGRRARRGRLRGRLALYLQRFAERIAA